MDEKVFMTVEKFNTLRTMDFQNWAILNEIRNSIIYLSEKEKYEIMWNRLKDQLRRDREQGHLQKTERTWLLMKEYEEEKDG